MAGVDFSHRHERPGIQRGGKTLIKAYVQLVYKVKDGFWRNFILNFEVLDEVYQVALFRPLPLKIIMNLTGSTQVQC